MINPGNIISTVAGWSLILLARITASSWSVGASLRTYISLVYNLIKL
jgi:hypothetical protein